MKRNHKFFLCGFAMTALLFSCNPVEVPPTPDDGGNKEEPTPGPGPEETTAEVTFSATTETLSEWEKGDRISIFDGKSIVVGENTETAGTTAKFKVTVAKGAKSYCAFFPETERLDAVSASENLAVDQTTVIARKPMIAKSSSSRLFFRDLTATVTAVIDMDDAASVKFAAVGAGIAGDYKIDYSGDDPVVASASSEYVEARKAFKRGETVSFTVLPVAMQGYKLTVFDKAGDAVGVIEVNEPATLAVNGVLELGPVRSVKELPKVYRFAHIWLYGGTGPGYNCARIYDLLDLGERSYVFDGPDGHGIDAVRDDYLEVWSDGTVNVYAGEDGKHWWMAVSQRLDPKDFKLLGVADKYSFMPKNHGSMEIGEDGAVTFTLDDGTTTTSASILAPGEVVLFDGANPDTGVPVKYAQTVEKMTLRYDNSNKADFWTPAGSDYDVFFSSPTTFLYELEEMPSDFVVPASAKTVDESFYDEPEYPEINFDVTTLPGTYTLNEYWVLGGSGNDPAFVGVLDKSWNWDDTVQKLKDDQLEIKVDQIGASVSGTITYGPGADGGYWDYIWTRESKYPTTDMSSVYGRLPKGETAYTCDLATGVIAFADGTTARLLTPGDHHFDQGNRDFNKLLDGMIGIEFDVMDPIEPSPYRWDDPDRFVVAPILYIMQFTKNK